ncbi:hypothetical protein ES5_04583 [Dietzia cinnamea P4]|nr:hypothetical protein ES5_04583 [Dietzia cinnamea P4]
MRKIDPTERVRGVVRAFRDRHGRRARALASRLEGDDDEVVLRPWELRLPRSVVYAAARSRGWEPVGGTRALVQRGPWLEPVHFIRGGDARPAGDAR